MSCDIKNISKMQIYWISKNKKGGHNLTWTSNFRVSKTNQHKSRHFIHNWATIATERKKKFCFGKKQISVFPRGIRRISGYYGTVGFKCGPSVGSPLCWEAWAPQLWPHDAERRQTFGAIAVKFQGKRRFYSLLCSPNKLACFYRCNFIYKDM